jgi:hypothetical protein
MPQIPTLPLSAEAKSWIDFCVDFQTLEGFIGVYEQKLSELKPIRRSDGTKSAAYEATEQLYQQLFGHRRYMDVEIFRNKLSCFRRSKK